MLFRWDQSSFLVHTPAKLNLFLEVLNKRPDGFHELETVMVMLGIYDTLRFSPTSESENPGEDIVLRVHDLDSTKQFPIPVGRDNLVVKAATLLKQETGCSGVAKIDLWKRIPAEAGLAGGSSDAAATLVGLNRLWKLNLAVTELQKLAAQLGSDVPFFLNTSRAAICRGRGEILEPVHPPLGLCFVIVKPESGLSTPEVFKAWRGEGTPQSSKSLVEALHRGPTPCLGNKLHNALQAPAEKLNADVSRLKSVFSQEPVMGHMMSGSGTAYFGICRHRRHAEFLAARLSSRRIGRVIVARSLL